MRQVRSCTTISPIADIADILDIPLKPQTIAAFSPNSAHYLKIIFNSGNT